MILLLTVFNNNNIIERFYISRACTPCTSCLYSMYTSCLYTTSVPPTVYSLYTICVYVSLYPCPNVVGLHTSLCNTYVCLCTSYV